MDFKKHWFGHSILWIGILYSTSECAAAETTASFTVDAVSHQSDLQQSDVPQSSYSDLLFPQDESDRPSKPILTVTTIAPPELMPAPLEQSKGVSWVEKSFSAAKQSEPVTPLEETESDSEANPSVDPELGNLQLQETEGAIDEQATETIDPELGNLRLQETDGAADGQEPGAEVAIDPELGSLRLRETQPVAPPEPDIDTVFLLGRIDYFKSDNILLDSIDPIDDQIVRGGATLLAVPDLGPNTQLVASIGGNFSRYIDLSDLDYNDLQFRLGIRQELFPRTYGEISWRNQQFFSADDGDRFLNDHSIRFSLSRRDWLAPKLSLDSFYQFRLSFTDPTDRSRLTNTLGVFLNYNLQPNLDVGLDYQLVLTDFTQQEREDAYHQLTAQLSYNLSRQSRISLFAGLSFGRSSEPEIGSDSGILGIVFDTSLSLF